MIRLFWLVTLVQPICGNWRLLGGINITTSRNEEFDYLIAKHPEMTDEAINAFLDEKVHDHVHVKSYILVFLALGVLTVFTVAASYLDVPFPVAIFLGLLIASVQEVIN